LSLLASSPTHFASSHQPLQIPYSVRISSNDQGNTPIYASPSSLFTQRSMSGVHSSLMCHTHGWEQRPESEGECRRVKFSPYGTINPGQDRRPQYLGIPNVEVIKAVRLGSAGSLGSPHLLHAPKKSILCPRGSKALRPSCEASPEPTAACAGESLVSLTMNGSPQSPTAARQTRRNTESGLAGHVSSCWSGESQNRQARGRALTGLPRLNMREHEANGESGNAAPQSPTALQLKLHR
jgi:hypothetical protein